MTKKELKKKALQKAFKTFLKKERIWEEYKVLVERYKGTRKVKEALQKYPTALYFGFFVWENTEQGYKYWETLELKWITLLDFHNEIHVSDKALALASTPEWAKND